MIDQIFKVRENKARRMADRQGLFLEKRRLRDHRAIGYGTYRLIDTETKAVVFGDPKKFGLSIDDVEAYLTREK